MSDHRPILLANRAFYVAFGSADFAAMDALWAQRSPVSCVHPGWGALFGREQVMRSWKAILGNARPTDIVFSNPAVQRLEDIALVLCTERVFASELCATNTFVLEDGAWKMVHHHASPVTTSEPRHIVTMPVGLN